MTTPKCLKTASLNSAQPAALECDTAIRSAINQAITKSHLSREEIAAEMTYLVGEQITANNLNQWTASSRTGWRFPLAYVAAFMAVTGTTTLLEIPATQHGCQVVKGRQIIEQQLGHLDVQESKLSAQRAALIAELGSCS